MFLLKARHPRFLHFFIMICFFRSSKSGHFSMYTCLLFKKQCWFLVIDWWQSLMAEQDLHLYHWAPRPAPRDTADSVSNFWGFMGHRRDFTVERFQQKNINIIIIKWCITPVGRILRFPQNSQPLVYTHLLPVIQSSTNVGAAVEGFCRCNQVPKSVGFKIRLYLAGPT